MAPKIFIGDDLFNFDEFVLRIAHALFSHSGKLAQSVTAFDAFFHVVAIAGGVNHIATSLVDGKNISGNSNADVLHSRFSGGNAFTVARDADTAHDVKEDNMLAEVIASRLCTVAH